MLVKIGGEQFDLTKDEVVRKIKGDNPEPIQTYGVQIQGQVYPCKQVLSRATGLPRAKFNAHQAYCVLERLGLPVVANNP